MPSVGRPFLWVGGDRSNGCQLRAGDSELVFDTARKQAACGAPVIVKNGPVITTASVEMGGIVGCWLHLFCGFNSEAMALTVGPAVNVQSAVPRVLNGSLGRSQINGCQQRFNEIWASISVEIVCGSRRPASPFVAMLSVEDQLHCSNWPWGLLTPRAVRRERREKIVAKGRLIHTLKL